MSSLWLVPVDGGTPTALTALNDGQNGPDIGDVNAWQLPAGTFVQALGGCGVVYLAKLNADGTTTKVSVPEADNHKSVEVVGFDGAALDLHATARVRRRPVLAALRPGDEHVHCSARPVAQRRRRQQCGALPGPEVVR